MKTIYKYIQFIKIEDKPKTSVYECLNKKYKIRIGGIKWFPSWRQYVFLPEEQTVFSKGCLEDINDFLEQLKRKGK